VTLHLIPYERLIACVTDELDAAEAALVASHLATCRECAVTVARFRQVREILNSEGDEEPPPATLAKARALFEQLLPGSLQRAPT
jgi:anti-sigma factor RsiW